jgi:hypothetical protein
MNMKAHGDTCQIRASLALFLDHTYTGVGQEKGPVWVKRAF